MYVDSTLIQASAAVDLMVPREDRAQPPLSIEEYVQRLYTENDEAPEDEKPPPAPPPLKRRRSSPSQYLRPNQELQRKADPDATLVNRPEFGRHLAYKAHVAVAGKRGQVITAAVATTGIEADEHLLAEVLWQHHRLSGLKLREVVADAKYGTSFNFLYLGRLDLPRFIPRTRFGNMRKDIWGREHFQWLPEEDAYLCPAGQRLGSQPGQGKPAGAVSSAQGQLRCLSFPHAMHTVRQRTQHRPLLGEEFVDRTEALLASPMGKQRLRERKTHIEGTFGLAKELHGLRRTRFRGRWRVQIQL